MSEETRKALTIASAVSACAFAAVVWMQMPSDGGALNTVGERVIAVLTSVFAWLVTFASLADWYHDGRL